MTDLGWINGAITGARPAAIGALLRYFRDLDTAEEAFQEAALRALKSWPENGPPRDPAAWLILVGRNAALDGLRVRAKHTALPPDEVLSDLDDAELPLAERLDATLEVQMIGLIRDLQRDFGCSILFISHSLALISELCDEVIGAAYDNAGIPLTGGRNDPAKFEWPALLRKLDRIDPSYKQ